MTDKMNISLPPSNLQALHNQSSLTLSAQKQANSSYSYRLNSAAVAPSFPKALTAKKNPKIPHPGLFRFGSSNRDSGDLPTVSECATHLELLAVFHQLRQRVLSSTTLDRALGIVPEPRTVYAKKYNSSTRKYEPQPKQVRDTGFEKRRQAKWPFFLQLAAQRFLIWAEVVERELDRQAESSGDSAILFPPLDVLMVWQSLLLNPGWFRSFSLTNLRATPFPWSLIHKAISSEGDLWIFSHPEGCSTAFTAKTGLRADLFHELIAQDHSSQFKDLLKKEGVLRDTPRGRGITVAEIDKLLEGWFTSLRKEEVNFFKALKTAIDYRSNKINDELVKAVTRQAEFVKKMENQLWIRSPAVEGTLRRAIGRYQKFLKLFKLYPGTTLVPTLDVDLVWHTHQCAGARYDAAMMAMTGRFLDHDDKLGQGILDNGFDKTATLFRTRFAEEYRVCNCWDCEALLSAVEAREKDPERSESEIAQEVYEEVSFHREVEIARRRGDTLLPLRK